MCFYDQYRFACGDWKWGHFRQHCNREYRTGETCGMKLILNTIPLLDECKVCSKINTKLRKRAFEASRVERWYRESSAGSTSSGSSSSHSSHSSSHSSHSSHGHGHSSGSGQKRSASMEKSLEAIKTLDEEIYALRVEIAARRQTVGRR